MSFSALKMPEMICIFTIQMQRGKQLILDIYLNLKKMHVTHILFWGKIDFSLRISSFVGNFVQMKQPLPFLT